MIVSSSCQTMFRVSEAFVEVMDEKTNDLSTGASPIRPALSSDARETSSVKGTVRQRISLNLQYFYRFHVLLVRSIVLELSLQGANYFQDKSRFPFRQNVSFLLMQALRLNRALLPTEREFSSVLMDAP
jgi:hypothetical protein